MSEVSSAALAAASEALIPGNRITEERVDGWFSALGGFGTTSDKRTAASYQSDVLDDRTIEELWRGDDLAARIIETVPDEAMRRGWELNVGDKELAEEIERELGEDGLNLEENVRNGKKIERAFGGGALFPVINDSTSSVREPLNEDKIAKIEHVQIFEPRELRPSKYYRDPLRPKFGRPETYLLFPNSTGGSSSVDVEIHETRLILFPGIRVTRVQSSPGGHGDSVLNRVFGVLRDYNISWASVAAILHDFAQSCFKIKGLAELIAKDRDDVIRARIQAVEMSRSTIRAVLMDSEEDFERKTTQVSGLAELLTALLTRVAAAADMPVTRLFGQAPAGLSATGEHEIRQWYDRIDTIRNTGMRPQARRLCYLQMKSRDSATKGKLPKSWSFSFKPLWQMSDAERAAYRKTVADTDKVYFDMGVVSAEEIALSRWSGNDFSDEMAIDFEERARLNAAGDTAAEPAPKGAPPAPPVGMPGESGVSPADGSLGPKGSTVPADATTPGDAVKQKAGPIEADSVPSELTVEQGDDDGDPSTPDVEFVTIMVRGHARKVRLRRAKIG